ncbi:MAG: DUF3050 domain-containing protein [Flavobacteriaceae bacterium]|jgi:hypothetical protein
MNHIQLIESKLEPLRDQLKSHPLYSTLSTIDDVAVFMEKHVFAVWDFMSLLKSLQNHLTNVHTPWTPKGKGPTARFINEIVMAEESDINELGEAMSHYEMYIDAMVQVGANTSDIDHFIKAINEGDDVDVAAKKINLEAPILEFINFTMDVVNSNKAHRIASAFTFGREDVIPDMFLEIVGQSKTSDNETYSKLLYYLNRHIELDGDEHGPISLKMVAELCGDDTQKWEEVLETAKEALKLRLKLWDHITDSILKLNTLEVQNT